MNKINNLNEWDGLGVALFTKEGLFEISISEFNNSRQERNFYISRAHRESGPAIISATKRWWVNEGRIHRIDGPAIEIEIGQSDQSEVTRFATLFFLDDQGYNEEEFTTLVTDAKKFSLAERLTDPRWWVREMK
jgi:hypothetical protein